MSRVTATRSARVAGLRTALRNRLRSGQNTGAYVRAPAPVAHVFIPSRDRALQLDGALRSLQRHCLDGHLTRITVLFKATKSDHRAAYAVVAREHPDIDFVEEKDFSSAARQLLGVRRRAPQPLFPRASLSSKELQLLVVDDTVFVRPFSLGSISVALEKCPGAIGFSLRLGETINFCQPRGLPSQPPPLVHVEGSGAEEIVSARWVGLKPDWGYPFDLSSSVYRRRDLAGLVRAISCDSPTALESALWQRASAVEDSHPQLLCFRKPRACSMPLNRVQQLNLNPVSGHHRHSVDCLVRLYLEGWRVDTAAYDGFLPHACHEELELLLRPVENIS
jgi:hypothetical protein